MTTTAHPALNIQPNIVRPCPEAFAARLFLFRINDRAHARQWLQKVAARVFKSSDDSDHWLNVSFTYEGLTALGVDGLDLEEFPEAFRAGMARRHKLLGDAEGVLDTARSSAHVALTVLARVRVNDKYALHAQLLAAGTAAQARPLDNDNGDALVASLEKHLDAICKSQLSEITDDAAAFGIELVATPQDLHHPIIEQDARPVGVEYFGFRDGVSQPIVDQGVNLNPQIVIAAGRCRPGSLLADGTFMVVRQLDQDVSQFWVTMEENYQTAGFASANELAEFLMGRKRNGQTLHAQAAMQDAQDAYEQPAFISSDDDERTPPRCPFQSHVRRVNPRLDGDKVDAMSPRLLRRSMSYRGAGSTGLMFFGFNADIERQFELIQGSWVQRGNHVGGLSSHCDPITSQVAVSGGAPAPTFVAGRSDGQAVALHLPSFVELKWGGYFFLPSRPALERLSRELNQVHDDPPLQLQDVLRWINSPVLARSFWTNHVPERGLRIEHHVFVKHKATVRSVLSDPHASAGFSVCEYGRKLRSISGPFVLGMDVDTADYQREVHQMRVIPRTIEKNSQIQQTARAATRQFIESHVAAQSVLGVTGALRSQEIIAVALSAVWGKHFGVPGPGRGSLVSWAQDITDAVFRLGQDDIKQARAEQSGKELRNYVLDQLILGRTVSANPALKELAGELAGLDDDDAARMLTGIMVGGLTAVGGTFVPGLSRWALQNRGSNLVDVIREASKVEQRWPLYWMLAYALERAQLGGPDYLYRRYEGAEAKRFQVDGQPHEPILRGDTVVSWVGGASTPQDTPEDEIRFGAGQHVCPGKEMARAIIDGIVEALGSCATLQISDERGLEFSATI